MKYVKCKLREEVFALDTLDYFEHKKRDLKKLRNGDIIALPYDVYHAALKLGKFTALEVFTVEEKKPKRDRKQKVQEEETSLDTNIEETVPSESEHDLEEKSEME